MFDRSFLPPAQTEFVVITDTHHMIDPGDRPLEFESRRKQTHRSEAALAAVRDLAPDFAVHLGDLVQEYPETPDFPRALGEALDRIASIGVDVHHCAGNHDVGDKPDGAMPTHPTTPEGLAAYHDRVGRSFYSFDHGDHHLVVLNSQIMNTDLPEAAEQDTWLDADLAAAEGRRIAVFIHLPPYLFDPSDPAFGNYDVIAEPARARLLDAVARHRVELLCAAHVHFAFFDRIGDTRYVVLPSPAFTRPGFSHLFTSPPPPEHGRDDTPKLAFYLFRSGPGFLDRHTIRTSGRTDPLLGDRVLTRTARSLPNARLGLTLTHTPAPVAQVPIAYPSVIRQTVRNDYPLLTVEEMGLRHLRVPIADIEDDDQFARLSMLRDRGTALTAILAAESPDPLPDTIDRIADRVDTLEIQLPAGRIDSLSAVQSPIPIALAPIDPSERVTGKQHLRTRIGFPVNRADTDHPYERTVVSIAPWESPLDLASLADRPLPKPLDVSLDLVDDDAANAERVAAAALLAASLPGARLFCQPSQDLDRTMDVANGFLDPLCNPRPVVTVYRLLNTLLFADPDADWRLVDTDPLTLQAGPRRLILNVAFQPDARLFDLTTGTAFDTPPKVAVPLSLLDISK